MMRNLGKTATALAALSLASAPAMAASPASKLSLRASTASENEQGIAGGAPIIALIGVAAIVAGGVIIATDDDDEPDSN
jgi:hypothetical protein